MKARLFLLAVLLAGCRESQTRVTASKASLIANGYDRLVFRIDGGSRPQLTFIGDRLSCHLREPHLTDQHWESELSAGVMPGTVKVKIASSRRQVIQTVTLLPQNSDSALDGTPDFMRLEDVRDRQSFRHWMTYLAELQFFISPEARPREIVDCSSLVRYSYREALKNHDAAWLAEAKLPVVLANTSLAKYSVPLTPLGPKIFRVQPGRFNPPDLTNGSFAEFADARTLRQFNTFLVSRDITRAQPGDILFYRRETSHGFSYHSMIFIGHSNVKPDSEIYVVYHTGPDGTNIGEIRRLTLTQLLHFPNPQWQPIAANELFLGVYRWNILKVIS